jgi:hypothetical protein
MTQNKLRLEDTPLAAKAGAYELKRIAFVPAVVADADHGERYMHLEPLNDPVQTARAAFSLATDHTDVSALGCADCVLRVSLCRRACG